MMRLRSNIEEAWAAGLFDGEGCACLCRGIRRVRRGRPLDPPRVYYSPVVSMVNTDLGLLQRFQRAVGFGRIRRMPPPTSSRHNQRYVWEASGKANVEALHAILAPYLSSSKMEDFARTLAGRAPHDEDGVRAA
jgi:hypothetical protein